MAVLSFSDKLIKFDSVLQVESEFAMFQEAPGSLEQGPGSYYFVQEKLGPMLNTEAAPEFRGAIILDSVLNFNDTVGSQILPLGFDFVS